MRTHRDWQKTRKLLIAMNSLSLDAPLVAVVWQYFLSRRFQIDLGYQHCLLLAVSVYLVYLADRWLDAFRLNDRSPIAPRYLFAWRHQGKLAGLFLLLLTTAALVALKTLAWPALLSGVILAGLVSLYFLLTHIRTVRRVTRFTREVFVATLFSLGVFLFLFTEGGSQRFMELLLPLGWTGLLFYCNLCSISAWERDRDIAAGHLSLATEVPALSRLLEPVLWTAAGASGVFFWQASSMASSVYLATVMSFICLAALNTWGGRFDLDVRRELADWALFSPAVVLVLSG